MNPDPFVLSVHAAQHARADRIRQERQDVLHKAAVARRRKAKRGGKR